VKEDGISSGQIIRRKQDGALEYHRDDLTIEEPLEIRIGRKTVATTMRTPGNDEELAAGFLLSEGIIRASDEIDKFSRPSSARNRENIITVTLAEGIKPKLNSTQRFGTISSSCGICGKESIAVIRQNFPSIESAPGIPFSSKHCSRFQRSCVGTRATSPALAEFTRPAFLGSTVNHAWLEKTSVDITLSIKLLAGVFLIANFRWLRAYFSLADAHPSRSCKRHSLPAFQLSPRSQLLRRWQWNSRANAIRP